MKKLLSLVLALTLVLSLCVVPARAKDVQVTGLSIDDSNATDVYAGQVVGYEIKGISDVGVDDQGATDVAITEYDWSVTTVFGTVTDKTKSVSLTAGAAGAAEVKCKVSVSYKKVGEPKTAEIILKKDVTIKANEVSFEPRKTSVDAVVGCTKTVILDVDKTKMPATGYTYAATVTGVESDTDIQVTATADEVSIKGLAATTTQKTLTVKVTATNGSTTVESATKTITVNAVLEDKFTITDTNEASQTMSYGGADVTLNPVLKYDTDTVKTPDVINTTSSNTSVVKVDSDNKTVKAVGKGTATVTVKMTYSGKEVSKLYTFTVKALDMDETAESGDYAALDASDVKTAAKNAVNSDFSKSLTESDITSVTVKLVSGSSYGTLYAGSSTSGTRVTSSAAVDALTNGLYFDAEYYAIGEAVYEVCVNGTYKGTWTFDVTDNGDINNEEIYAYVDSTTKAKFTLPSGYDVLYYTTSAPTDYDGVWSTANGWKTCSSSTDGELYISDFSAGKKTIYVVGKDTDEKEVYTGTMTVYLEDFNIEYSGAVGETVTFDQDDFEEFMQDYFEATDSGYSSKKDYPCVEFSSVKFPSVTSANKWTVYYNGTAAKKNTEYTDMDKVSVELGSKASDSVTIEFQLYFNRYTSASSKKADHYTGYVVIDVADDVVKMTVNKDTTVAINAAAFETSFNKSYTNGTLSYVMFHDVPSYATTFTALQTNAYNGGTFSESTKFYYTDPSNITNFYSLNDVVVRVTSYATVGTKVQIPFTAYGCKSGKLTNSNATYTSEGILEITISNKTMAFTDVKTTDWFYTNVQKAYNMGLIDGKTTTTFAPNDNMTYAEAIKLACAMNQLYYNGSVTLTNGTTTWYSTYMTYALQKGIISADLSAKANSPISRKDDDENFHNALAISASTAYAAKNSISKIPDVANDTTNAKIYTFYKAGILTGYTNTVGKTNYSFGPSDNIKRSEVATILIRMMDATTRVAFTL